MLPEEGEAGRAPLDASLDRHVVSLCQVKGPGHIIEEVLPEEGGAGRAPLDASLDRHVVSLCQVKGPGHH